MSNLPKTIFSSFSRKGDDTVYHIGAEQRHITSLLNTHLNNLEEQFIFGVDMDTESWHEEDGSNHVVIKYRSGDEANYYQTEQMSTTTSAIDQIKVEDGVLQIKDKSFEKIWEYSTDEVMIATNQVIDNQYSFYHRVDEEGVLTINAPVTYVDNFKLYYIDNNKDIKKEIAEKTELTYTVLEPKSESGIKTVKKTAIVNKLDSFFNPEIEKGGNIN